MSILLKRIGGGGCLVTLASGLLIAGSGSAQGDPGACYIDQGLTDAVARCHDGDGASVLEIECVGLMTPSTPDGQIFGAYSGTDSVPSPVGQPMRASCISDDTLGFTTRAFVTPK
ncbi:hypothetical protein F5X71_09015 [Nocardia brasiliensis]|uniref:Secreted protein n=1 Tax=Nocardia brasiliensis TaxID=37326 RepID=A0A6G9XNE6_NOCBR|nr:hypothetical protein [Nocardia brasiliensis]QIS02445.1 hypothetical protein F5X71_09015 [Nocardia brasiliensis]